MKRFILFFIFCVSLIPILGKNIEAQVTHEELSFESLPTAIAMYERFAGEQKNKYEVMYRLADNPDFADMQVKLKDASFNTTDKKYYSGFIFTRLEPGKTYYAQVVIWENGIQVFTTPSETITTKPANIATDQPGTKASFSNRGYKPLAFLPGFTDLLPTNDKGEHRFPSAADCAADPNRQYCNFGDFLNFIIELAIALAAVMLVIKLVINGYAYMTQDVPFLKLQAKTKITESIIGILLALTAYLLLNTINPSLVNNSITLGKAVLQYEVVNLPDAGDETVDPDFKSKTASYSTDASLSPELAIAVEKLKNGWEIKSFKIYTNKRMLITLAKGNESDSNTVISVDIGVNGFAEPGTGISGDKKTPKGTWKIIDVRKPKTPGRPVFNKNGSNMGAAFFHLSPTVNGERGIGIHGNKHGTLSPTIGCIRMKNADILALLPYVKSEIPVYIGDN